MKHLSTSNPGHFYELPNFENKDSQGQHIQFIEKQPKEVGSVEFRTVEDGTTNEEVLEVLIHRLGCMAAKFPSRETSIAITKLEESLMWLNKRTNDRIKRGVEGKAIL